MDKDSINIYGLTIVAVVLISLLLVVAGVFADSGLKNDNTQAIAAANNYMDFPDRSAQAKGITAFTYTKDWSPYWNIANEKWREGDANITSSDLDFHASSYRENIINVYFEDYNSVPSDCIKSWDISAGHDKKIMAWVMANDSKYDLHIGQSNGVVGGSNLNYMFCGFSNLKAVHFNDSFIGTSVSSMMGMFQNCSSLTEIDFRNVSTPNCANMVSMFQGCKKLNQIDISMLDLENVRDLTCAFYGCVNLKAVEIGNHNSQNLISISHMFDGCTLLQTLDFSEVYSKNISKMDYAFANCSNLTKVTVPEEWGNSSTNRSNLFTNSKTNEVSTK